MVLPLDVLLARPRTPERNRQRFGIWARTRGRPTARLSGGVKNERKDEEAVGDGVRGRIGELAFVWHIAFVRCSVCSPFPRASPCLLLLSSSCPWLYVLAGQLSRWIQPHVGVVMDRDPNSSSQSVKALNKL
jgi:hypothetical protein